MKKNAASQVIGAQMTLLSDGTAFTGSATCYVTIDNGSQTLGSVSSGAATSKGNGYYTYAPSQAETNGDYLAYTFIGTGAGSVTVAGYATHPQTADVAAGVTVNDKTGFSLGSSQTFNLTGNVTGNLSGSVGSVTSAVTAASVTDKSGFAPSPSQNASAVRTELSTELTRIDAAISTRNATAPDNSGIASIKAKTDNLPASPAATGAEMALTSAYDAAKTAAPTAAGVADAVLDELLVGHQITGSLGKAVIDAGAAGNPWEYEFTIPGSDPVETVTAGGLQYQLYIPPILQPVIVLPAPPPDESDCLCYLDIEDGSGVTHAGVSVEFTLSSYPAVADRAIQSAKVTAVTDSDGRLEVVLKRTDSMSPTGRKWIVSSAALGIRKKPMELNAVFFNMTEWLKT